MDIHLDLSDDDDQISYLTQQSLLGPLQAALQNITGEQPTDPLLILSELLGRVEGRDCTLVEGFPVACCNDVELGVGPVVGEVTHNKVLENNLKMNI